MKPMRFLRLFVALLSGCLITVLVLAGCVDSTPTGGVDGSGAGDGSRRVLRVAAASDLRFAMGELIAAFDKEHPDVKVQVSYGSSGNFYSQLTNGAPFDVFFSADMEYPGRLTADGLTVPGSSFEYGIGRLVLWVPPNSRLDVEMGLGVLVDPAVQKVSIANPDHAPYGRAAVAALEDVGFYAKVKPKLVYGENIAQAAEFVQSGSADAGVIALSLAIAPPMKNGSYWEIPPQRYPRITQGGVIMRRTRLMGEAVEFRDFVISDAGRMILSEYGFTLPDESSSKPINESRLRGY